MKFKFDFTSILGGVAGGVAASYVEDLVRGEDTEKDSYTPAIIQAVAGAAVSAIAPQGVLKGLGNGMIGAAGYQIGKILGESSDSDKKVEGVGLLPGQNAIGALRNWKRRSRVGSADTAGQNAVQSVM